MFDDIVIFVIAMVTLEITDFGGRLAKFSGWVGGAIMIAIGLMLLFKPGLLMFG
jgi:hypothetical protein